MQSVKNNFSCEVGLNIALGLFISSCSRKTAWWRPLCCWLKSQNINKYFSHFCWFFPKKFKKLPNQVTLTPKINWFNVPFPASFSFIYAFSIELTVNQCFYKIAHDWIRTADLWCRIRNRRLNQLSHNHCQIYKLFYCQFCNKIHNLYSFNR